jgi:hypothetical protein
MNSVPEPYLDRRKKEELAFLVVRFLKAFTLFEGIHRDFRKILDSGLGFGGSGLFARVRDLEEKLVFDIKEKAHFLFRSSPAMDADREGGSPYAELEQLLLRRRGTRRTNEAREVLARLRRSLVDRAIDSNIGTGFHLFMILRECIYQLEVYAPRYGLELKQAERIEYLSRRIGSALDEEEAHELERIRQVVKRGQSVASYTLELAERALERSRTLFSETAELLRHLIEEADGNEVLLLNLLANRQSLDAVYGPGAAEQILAHMHRHIEPSGASGLAKAMEQARKRCGNTEALEQEPET